MKLAGKAYWWWKDNNRFCRCWFVLQDFFRTRYAPHILCASEADCNEPNVEHEPELERPQFSDLIVECKEILPDVGVILESMPVEDPEPKPEVDVEPELGLEVIVELLALQKEISSRPTEVEELPIKTLVDLSA